IGGGSTELMDHRGGGRSLDIGSVRFTERFLKSDPVTDAEFWACQAGLDSEIQTLRSWRAGLSDQDRLLGVAGTLTTLASWHLGLREFSRERIDAAILTRGDVHRMVEELKWRTKVERATLPGVEEGRAGVILAGALILWRVMEILDFGDCRVSTRGLRYGVLAAAL
ncbi:MAG: Ppx/GppA family phosphatase, partial [Bdellovibrionota bacterium]